MIGAWPDLLKVVWPIASIITPFLMGAFVWWFRKEFVSMADFLKLKVEREQAVAELRRDLDANNLRSTRIEEAAKAFRADFNQPPSRLEMMRDISDVSRGLAALGAGVEGIKVQAATTNRLLQLLLEREGSR